VAAPVAGSGADTAVVVGVVAVLTEATVDGAAVVETDEGVGAGPPVLDCALTADFADTVAEAVTDDVGCLVEEVGVEVFSWPDAAAVEDVRLEPPVGLSCAPPELDTTTPGATSVLVCDGDDARLLTVRTGLLSLVRPGPAASVFGVAVEVVGDIRGSGSEDPPVGEPVSGFPPSAGEVGEFPPSGGEVSEESVGVAHATPGVVATAAPTPNATARPPTRPTKLA
jgi:hypothetical protein